MEGCSRSSGRHELEHWDRASPSWVLARGKSSCSQTSGSCSSTFWAPLTLGSFGRASLMVAGSTRVGDLSTGELLSRQLGFASMDAELRSWAQGRPAQELSCGAEVARYARAELVLES